MIASLMMYARPQLDRAHRRYWNLIRENLHHAGITSPEHLSQNTEEFAVWQHPDLVLSQTCGMPYRIWLHEKVALVGTPDYGLAGCPPGYYRSALIVRADDQRADLTAFRGAVFAYNQTFSQSGYAAPYWHLRPYGFWFENRVQTEGHLRSAQAVADGRADIAALDAVSWRLMAEYEDLATSLRVLDWTEPTPGLPLITAMGNDPDTIFCAVERAIEQLDAADRTALGIKGIVRISAECYLDITNPPGSV
ncbi:ABC transporter, phosphonate, substrate-binding protein [Ruegeria halocynthiae]|uniref:ABC transporter, phosphonate, substrate-binding protein n=1 Tax=Ruegeria halocynthiae TaxID=985054 RepID=A0A1H3BJU2_9RHOB|nr:PhnD/SsuA/transferrin family substrate-binding protein [Ruegeria halocynthiae]SDX42222.1 ABC transporter, phosphonate, substrate-binding protein [Ruegeria halocynthiae]